MLDDASTEIRPTLAQSHRQLLALTLRMSPRTDDGREARRAFVTSLRLSSYALAKRLGTTRDQARTLCEGRSMRGDEPERLAEIFHEVQAERRAALAGIGIEIGSAETT